jgi:hypothetical protein
MALAALAILGHRSAHSFPIGLVIADPANRTDHAQGALEIQFKKKKKNRKKKTHKK